MTAFAHTPYDGSAKPFTIGLSPLDLDRWFEPDLHLVPDLTLKARLLETAHDVVFAEELDTAAAQAEARDLIAAHLLARHGALYNRSGDTISVTAGPAIDLAAPDMAPLEAISRLVQEDLVLMRDSPAGYRLVAASLCFPSSWSLVEKFGQTLDAVHEHVPHYADKLGARMNRIFASLRTEIPVTRLNWSIYPDGERHYPKSKAIPRDWFDDGSRSAFIRVERQTLRRLPVSGDILFTIKILADPIAGFATHPDGARLARSLADQIRSLDGPALDYKRLREHQSLMVDELERVAALAEG